MHIRRLGHTGEKSLLSIVGQMHLPSQYLCSEVFLLRSGDPSPYCTWSVGKSGLRRRGPWAWCWPSVCGMYWQQELLSWVQGTAGCRKNIGLHRPSRPRIRVDCSIAMHRITLCIEVITVCNEVITLCIEVITLCIEVITLCIEVMTVCNEVITLCIELITLCNEVIAPDCIAYQSQARGWNAYPHISWSSRNLHLSSSSYYQSSQYHVPHPHSMYDPRCRLK